MRLALVSETGCIIETIQSYSVESFCGMMVLEAKLRPLSDITCSVCWESVQCMISRAQELPGLAVDEGEPPPPIDVEFEEPLDDTSIRFSLLELD